jgi:Fe-S-cluster containining protein
MNINKKLKILNSIYNMHDSIVADKDFACRKFCSHCCSCNLTVTSLETYKIFSELGNKKDLFLKRLNFEPKENRFLPEITLNKMAELCSYGKELPNENIKHNVGKCFALYKGECTIYNIRPFACRSMLSSENCANKGFASIDSYMMALHNVFSQYIEHIDSLGYTSNFYDMAIKFEYLQDDIASYYKNEYISADKNIIRNQKIHTLMIPPDHREQIQSLIKNIVI